MSRKNLRLLTHLIDGRRCLEKAKSQADGNERHEIERSLQIIERMISNQVGDDWEEL